MHSSVLSLPKNFHAGHLSLVLKKVDGLCPLLPLGGVMSTLGRVSQVLGDPEP